LAYSQQSDFDRKDAETNSKEVAFVCPFKESIHCTGAPVGGVLMRPVQCKKPALSFIPDNGKFPIKKSLPNPSLAKPLAQKEKSP
jgi:hypothetical protein